MPAPLLRGRWRERPCRREWPQWPCSGQRQQWRRCGSLRRLYPRRLRRSRSGRRGCGYGRQRSGGQGRRWERGRRLGTRRQWTGRQWGGRQGSRRQWGGRKGSRWKWCGRERCRRHREGGHRYVARWRRLRCHCSGPECATGDDDGQDGCADHGGNHSRPKLASAGIRSQTVLGWGIEGPVQVHGNALTLT